MSVTGSAAPQPQGGDRSSGRIEAQTDLILALVAETCDITLTELQSKLTEHGHRFGIGTLWRFFDRHGITWKKRPHTQANRIALTS